MNPLQVLQQRVHSAVPNVLAKVTEPSNPKGMWWLDLEHEGRGAIVQWIEAKGFGVSDMQSEAGYGEGPEEMYTDIEPALEQVLRLLGAK